MLALTSSHPYHLSTTGDRSDRNWGRARRSHLGVKSPGGEIAAISPGGEIAAASSTGGEIAAISPGGEIAWG